MDTELDTDNLIEDIDLECLVDSLGHAQSTIWGICETLGIEAEDLTTAVLKIEERFENEDL